MTEMVMKSFGVNRPSVEIDVGEVFVLFCMLSLSGCICAGRWGITGYGRPDMSAAVLLNRWTAGRGASTRTRTSSHPILITQDTGYRLRYVVSSGWWTGVTRSRASTRCSGGAARLTGRGIYAPHLVLSSLREQVSSYIEELQANSCSHVFHCLLLPRFLVLRSSRMSLLCCRSDGLKQCGQHRTASCRKAAG